MNKSAKLILAIALSVTVLATGSILIFTRTDVIPNDNYADSDYFGNEPIVPQTQHQEVIPDGYIGIYSADDLQRVNLNQYGNYILMNDIDLSGFDFESLEIINSTFDGNYYSINNYHGSEALFGSIEYSTVKNLTLNKAQINSDDGGYNHGGIIDFSSGESFVTDCHFNGTIVIDCTRAYYDSWVRPIIGGIIGNCYSRDNLTIYRCSFNGGIRYTSSAESTDAYVSIGGIIGNAGGYVTIEECFSSGQISAINKSGMFVGGICGFAPDWGSCVIENCYNAAKIETASMGEADLYTPPTFYTGGIIGNADKGKEIRYCHNIGELWTDFDQGGICGNVEGGVDIQYCYFSDFAPYAVSNGMPLANVSSIPTDSMNDSVNFRGFDFQNIWEIKDNNYPTLINNRP